MPSSKPSAGPSSMPSMQPSSKPSGDPSSKPSSKPSADPSLKPSLDPSSTPSSTPSDAPSAMPSMMPSSKPSLMPSSIPSLSSMPSSMPFKSLQPSFMPSCAPFKQDSPVRALDSNNEIQFEFTGLEPAMGEVVITFFHKGDNSEFGNYDLKVDTFSLGESLTGENTPCTDYVESPTRTPVTSATFNNAYLKGGVLKVSMMFNNFGGNTCPARQFVVVGGAITGKSGGQEAYVSLQYPYAGCGNAGAREIPI
jgi:hypothetical protein